MLIHKTTLALAVSAIVTQSVMADGTSSANSESQNQNNKDVVVVVRDKADDQLTSKPPWTVKPLLTRLPAMGT